MARRPLHTVTPFSRDYRRPPRWTMGLPPKRPRRRFRKWVWLGVLLALLFLPRAADVVNAAVKDFDGCRIWGVIDGDTVRLHCPASGFTTGRILAYDTPETDARCVSEFARAMAATQYLRWILLTGWEISARTEGTDRYGRDLVVVIVDGEGVARRMVEAGLARWYDGGVRPGWCGEDGGLSRDQ